MLARYGVGGDVLVVLAMMLIQREWQKECVTGSSE